MGNNDNQKYRESDNQVESHVRPSKEIENEQVGKRFMG